MTELPNPRSRINSIDVLRGIVMVVMALDHVRDFFHEGAFTGDPLDPQTSYPALFFTRWITHYCAPVFVFLAGTSAYLFGLKRTKAQISSFLIKRGVWLVLIEITIVTLGWTFNPLFNLFILQVIWAIGISMIILGLLIYLPLKLLLVIGALIVFGHNLLDPLEAAKNHQVSFVWNLVHHANFSFYPITNTRFIIIVYAFLPWAGVMILGYCFGALFRSSVEVLKRRRILIAIGLSLVGIFLLLRLINFYGDPVPWTKRETGMRTIFSFLNVSKYPPSLLFLCMTIGPAIILLAFLETKNNMFTRITSVYGRVPFFYYVVHLYLIHACTVVVFFASGYTTAEIVSPQTPFLFRPQQFGFDLWIVYLVWVLVVIILYPICRWYNRYKSSHGHWWLSYV